jgi:photosystem II stability/assembly factor-like uncharacterized protein
MLRNKLKWLIVLLLVSLVLTACVGGTASTPTAVVVPTTPPVSLTAPGPDLTPAVPSEGATGLAFNPSGGGLFKADSAGLFHLPADAQAWEAIQTSAARNAGLTGVAINPDDPATLYVSGAGLGVLKSTDGGQSWSEINDGLVSEDVTTLAMHSFRYATLYVWLKDIGIFRTEDSGAHWARMPDQGPPDTAVRGLAHSTLPGSMNTGWLYASTPSGVYLSMDCF